MSINGVGKNQFQPTDMQSNAPAGKKGGSTFGSVMGKVADGALAAVSTVAPALPGGSLVKAAADGLRDVKNGSKGDLGPQDQMDKAWAMQKENQVFNLQYMQLQNEVQSDNRRFSTMSNLMKVRHDTAKAAINNMHA